MMVWLVSYYEFYDKNVSPLHDGCLSRCKNHFLMLQIKSPSISDAIGSQEFSQYFEHGEIKLIQSFINCDLMINIPECERLYHQSSNQTGAITNDPINELFILRKKGKAHCSNHIYIYYTIFVCDPQRMNYFDTLWLI